VDYLKEQGPPQYSIVISEPGESGYGGGGGDDDVDDELFEACVKLVVTNGQASTSMLQRRFKIGYTRAARIVDVMQERGIVGPPDGAKPREVLMTRFDAERLFQPSFDTDEEE
jgi:S-DNA-T family DNA segregation ATPase FtsK/SpoIIIE